MQTKLSLRRRINCIDKHTEEHNLMLLLWSAKRPNELEITIEIYFFCKKKNFLKKIFVCPKRREWIENIANNWHKYTHHLVGMRCYISNWHSMKVVARGSIQHHVNVHLWIGKLRPKNIVLCFMHNKISIVSPST